MFREYNKLIFEISRDSRKGYTLPDLDVEADSLDDILGEENLREKDAKLPQVSEVDVVRHFTKLSNKNYSVDHGIYPLGSCTMKYNPKINEELVNLSQIRNLHPMQPLDTVQGALRMMYDLQEMLAEIAGMAQVSLQPAAGSQGELTGLMMVKAFHNKNGEDHRYKVIVPDSAHGTNPATASMVGYELVEVKSNEAGTVDMDNFKELVDDDIAAFMLTNPNTVGIFEKDIVEIAKMVHDAGGLLYYDGANMNANLGITRPGDMGFDILHYNLHKTFSTPHGGGGPGSGPVGVVEKLVEFLPLPLVEKQGDKYTLKTNSDDSIGSLMNFYGNFGVMARAYVYMLMMGGNGLKKASELAVLNANYLKEVLKKEYILPVDDVCKHEFVLAGIGENEAGVTTLDIAKRLIDYGYHPPTVYFPLIIDSAMMIEPTETESKESLDGFAKALLDIAKEAKDNPELLHAAPLNAPVTRLDEVKAARELILTWES
ncbi:MAG: aminomethyl-transferring glycine dehydrogenase subunit GcvPB [Clostridia bacterium]